MHSIKQRQALRIRGLTLIELLVVLVILGLLAGLVAPRVIHYLSTSKTETAQLQIKHFEAALDLYRLDVGSYPNTQQGLEALIKAPPGVSNWHGPYLKSPEVPKDPWGRPFIYTSPGKHGPYDIESYGADGQPGGTGENEDVKSW
jgi:general secretion pathway protein G